MSRFKPERYPSLALAVLLPVLLPILLMGACIDEPDPTAEPAPERTPIDPCDYQLREIVDPDAEISGGWTINTLLANLDSSHSLVWVGWDPFVTWPTSAPEGQTGFSVAVAGDWSDANFFLPGVGEPACKRMFEIVVPVALCTEDEVLCGEVDAFMSFNLTDNRTIMRVRAPNEAMGIEVDFSGSDNPPDYTGVQLWLESDQLSLDTQASGGWELYYYWETSANGRFDILWEFTEIANVIQP